MRKVVASVFVSLDGVMQAPGGPEEDRSGGFEQGGWLVPYFDDDMGKAVTTWFARTRFEDGVRVVGLGRYLTNTSARALYDRLGFLDVEYVGGTRGSAEP